MTETQKATGKIQIWVGGNSDFRQSNRHLRMIKARKPIKTNIFLPSKLHSKIGIDII